MARTAVQLDVSQPVVSEAIADLEATIGVPLLFEVSAWCNARAL
jgi:DNA-binding transcriptional LysR family regulator